MTELCDLGVYGLDTMGANLARNAARNGFGVALFNRTKRKIDDLVSDHGDEGRFVATKDVVDFVAAIRRPRVVVLLVAAGDPVDAVIAHVAPHLEEGDVLVDAGNSLFEDTERRAGELGIRGILYVGMGVSGGEVGALEGPSMMPGGPPQAWERIAPIVTAMSAKVDGEPCVVRVGPGGSGHFVKMVHNGIEYADMQLIAETWDVLRSIRGMDAMAASRVFDGWRDGPLASYLVDIAAEVLAKRDPSGDGALVDAIVDEAAQKGTGRWTARDALALGVPLTTVAAAVDARVLSSGRDLRRAASGAHPDGPQASAEFGDADLDALRDALLAAKLVAYAQGFALLAEASVERGWNLDLAAIARIWRGGCIIRARLLDRIVTAYSDEAPGNLLLDPWFGDTLTACVPGLRRTIAAAVGGGVPAPAMSAALAYFDGLRRERSPADLIQGLRDRFGSHTYRRRDADGVFHVDWAQDESEDRVDQD